MRGLRACPVCPKCGFKKFRFISNEGKTVLIECRKCSGRLKI